MQELLLKYKSLPPQAQQTLLAFLDFLWQKEQQEPTQPDALVNRNTFSIQPEATVEPSGELGESLSYLLSNVAFELRTPQTAAVASLYRFKKSFETGTQSLSSEQCEYLDECTKCLEMNLDFIVDLGNHPNEYLKK